MNATSSDEDPEGAISPELIESARAGSTQALEQLFQLCRPYLFRVANDEFPDDLRAKAGASDLVQQSYLEAHENFDQFEGHTPDELRHWLRRILVNNQANFVRQFRFTEMREVAREEVLDTASSSPQAPAASEPSPSEEAVRRENLERLRLALERLPEEYRRVIQWHQQERLTFDEIGARLGRTGEAARKLWARGVEKLREELGEPPSAP